MVRMYVYIGQKNLAQSRNLSYSISLSSVSGKVQNKTPLSFIITVPRKSRPHKIFLCCFDTWHSY